MNQSKGTRPWTAALVFAAFMMSGGTHVFAQVTGPDVVTGTTFTVNYTRRGTITYLQERIGIDGTWTSITSVNGGSGQVPYTFTNKSPGQYFYRTYARVSNVWWTSAESRISVMGPLPSNRDTIANQTRYTYQARIGDINYDGLLDLFISRTAGGSAGNGSLQDVILRNVSGGNFAADTPTAAQLAAASAWPLSAVELRKIDMNLDGFLDLSIPELGNYISGALGQIVVAPGSAGPAVLRVIPRNAKFNKFMTQTKGWLQNPNYFIDNSPVILTPVWGWAYVCDWMWIGDEYQYYCDYIYTIVAMQSRLDTSWYDAEAYYLRTQFTQTLNGILQPVVEPGTPQGMALDHAFALAFGVQAFRGNYRSYCINWDYDTDTYHPPCVDWALALLQTLRDLMPEDVSDWRYLTAGEKAEAVGNGMQIVGVDEVRVYNGARFNLWFEQGNAAEWRGHVYIGNENPGMPWSTDYSIHYGPYWTHLTVLIHELTHVYQTRTMGCGVFCQLRVGPYWPSPDDYIYMPLTTCVPRTACKVFEDYNVEQQATMVMDRFQLRKTGLPYSSNTGVTIPMLNLVIPF